MSTTHDAVVVGAGPYGLSAAAHLRGRGLDVATFGKPLGLWRDCMPKGMLLRSHWWATNLSDPERRYGFERFFRESRYRQCYPVPIDCFIDYGLWFQERAVPDVDETYVAGIERVDGRFHVTLADGREVTSAAVVIATGPYSYAHRPAAFDGLPAGTVSHSCEHADFGRFAGQRVLVIGGGQSAIEYAALLHEAGAATHVAARRPIVWLDPDRAHDRTFFEKLRAPNASIAQGWDNWILDRMPYLFYRLPQPRKDGYNSNYHSGASDWLRNRVLGKVTLHEGQTVVGLDAGNGGVAATLSGGRTVRTDHVLLATGYKVDLDRLTMIGPALRAQVATDLAIPVLNHWFESTVPGLYFVGLTSLRAFGPLYRFVAGTRAAAERVAGAVARGLAGTPKAAAHARPRGIPRTDHGASW